MRNSVTFEDVKVVSLCWVDLVRQLKGRGQKNRVFMIIRI